MERWRGGEVERWSHSSNIVPSAVMPHLSLPRLAAVLCRRPSCRTSPFPGRQQCCAVGRHAAPPALSLSLTHTHTLSHSLTHTHTHLLTHLLTHSHTHSPPTHSLLPNCLTHSFTHSLTLSLTHSYGWGSSMCVWMGAVHVCVDGGRACVCGWGACMCVWMGAAVEIQWPAVEIQWPAVEIQAVEIQWPAVEIQWPAVEIQWPAVHVHHSRRRTTVAAMKVTIIANVRTPATLAAARILHRLLFTHTVDLESRTGMMPPTQRRRPLLHTPLLL